jgi:hypothetical protein
MAMIALGAIVFAILLVAFALGAIRRRAEGAQDAAVSSGDAYLSSATDGGSAHAGADSACVASHGADCAPGH